ncbi:TPA: hypothetical protein O8U17_002523 [Enterobacter asburiae]|nr:hypothetical protein [Enterobacter asburiae]
MRKFLAITLLSLSGYTSAGTYTVTCENGTATKDDGSTYVIKHASLTSDGEKSVLTVEGHTNNLPPLSYQSIGYITTSTDKNNMKLTVTTSDGITPHTAALVVSVEDVNGNAIWGMMAAGCASHKTK